jgi:hypothetical protein
MYVQIHTHAFSVSFIFGYLLVKQKNVLIRKKQQTYKKHTCIKEIRLFISLKQHAPKYSKKKKKYCKSNKESSLHIANGTYNPCKSQTK